MTDLLARQYKYKRGISGILQQNRLKYSLLLSRNDLAMPCSMGSHTHGESIQNPDHNRNVPELSIVVLEYYHSKNMIPKQRLIRTALINVFIRNLKFQMELVIGTN